MSISISLDYRPLLGAIRDQHARPTCLAHAATTAHEHARRSQVALSPEYLHYFASSNDPSPEGVGVSSISHALLEPGQPSETDCPYHLKEPSPTWTPPSNVTLYRRRSTSALTDPDNVEALLKAGHAPVLCIATPDAFYEPAPPWIISSTGPVRGLHAVVAVGFGTTHTTRRFLIRNSWGTKWANAGHAWLDDVFLLAHLRDVLLLTDEVN